MTDSHAPSAGPAVEGWPRGATPFERRFGNGTTRILTALVAIPVVLSAIWYGGIPFALLVAVIATGALMEFYWITEASGARPMKGIGLVIGTLLLASFVDGVGEQVVPELRTASDVALVYANPQLLLVTGLILTGTMVVLVLGMYRDNAHPVRDDIATIAGYIYVSLSMGTLLGLRSSFENDVMMIDYLNRVAPSLDHATLGAYTVMAMMASIWTCDSAAYFAGRAFGRHPLFSRISPRKTWEGGIAGGIGAVGAMIAAKIWLLPYLTVVDAVLLGLCAGVAGQLGDLAESHLKRDAGVKDSSQIIPGHGGLLDRFDSLLFVAPLWYIYHLFLVSGRV